MDAIARALALLATLGINVPNEICVIDRSPVIHTSTETRAYTIPGDTTIYVLRRTARGDVRQLAATIVHELTHIEEGVYEGPAYDAELAVLRALHADTSGARVARELYRFDYPKEDRK